MNGHRMVRAAALAAVLLAGGVATPAAAAPTGAAAPRCTYTYDWTVTTSGTGQGAGATWDESCGNTMQVRAICHNYITGTTYDAYSGEVHGNGILDWAGCGFDDTVLAGQIQPTDCDCSTWHTFWLAAKVARDG